MKCKRIIPCIVLLILAASALVAQTKTPRYLEITFLSTNDLHTKLWPFTIAANPAKNTPEMKDVGGAARRATVIRKVRSEMRTPVLLTDAGDIKGWTAFSSAYHGKADVAVMNALGYDVMALGNHEFEWHPSDTSRNLKESEFPWICANIVYAKTGELFTQPYIIREVEGVQIAFFALINTLPSSQPNYYKGATELGLKVLNATETAAKLVPELRQKADIVVLISHLGYRADVQLAKDVPGIDLILGGHSHSVILHPTLVPVAQPTAFYLGAVPVEQAGYYGIYLGQTKVVFHKDRDNGHYTLMNCKGELIPIDSSIPDDPEITALIQDFQKRIPHPPPAK